MKKCPKCGAPARHMPPDGDFKYDPPISRAPQPDTVTEEMVTAAINALVYTGYNDETQKRVIRGQATCRKYVRDALTAALSAKGK